MRVGPLFFLGGLVEQTSVQVERRIWFAFQQHCRSKGFAGKRVVEQLMTEFLQQRGVTIPEDHELPPVMSRVAQKV